MSLFSDIDKIFVEETPGGNRIAKFINLKRKNEPELPIPGLKRYCQANSRFRKLIVETTGSRIEAKRFLLDIDISEIREVKLSQKPLGSSVEKVKNSVSPPVENVKKSGMSEENREKARQRMKLYHEKKKLIGKK